MLSLQELEQKKIELFDILNREVEPQQDVHLEEIKVLLSNLTEAERTEIVNAKFTHQNISALHCLVIIGHLATAEFLLQNGADINAKATNGSTPLDLIVPIGHLATAKFLLQNGADINTRDINGSTLLHVAANARQLEMAVLLIKYGADIHAKSINENTPLHYATMAGELKIVKLLIENGADVHATNNKGDTPLHLSAPNDHLAIAKLLLQYGTNVNTKTKDGITPLQYSGTLSGNFTTTKLFLEHGADINALNDYGFSTLQLSAQNEKLFGKMKLLLDEGAEVSDDLVEKINNIFPDVALIPHPKKPGVFLNGNASVLAFKRDEMMQAAKDATQASTTRKYEVPQTTFNLAFREVAKYLASAGNIFAFNLLRCLSKEISGISQNVLTIEALTPNFKGRIIGISYSRHFNIFYNNPDLLLEENKEPKKPEKKVQEDKETSSENTAKPYSHVAKVEEQRKSKAQENPEVKSEELSERLRKRDEIRKKWSEVCDPKKDGDQPEQLKNPSSRWK